MENVPQVHGKKNIADFEKWCECLRQLGYTNFWQDLNAKDYGIPQNRDRCFMVSILGDGEYLFPQPTKLTKLLKDMLEDSVDEKFYLSDALIKYFVKHTQESKEKGNGFRFTPTCGNCVGKAVTTRAGGRMDDNFIFQIPHGYNKGGIKKDSVCPTITTSAFEQNNFILAYDEQNKYFRKDGTIGTLTTDGSTPKHNNRIVNVEDCSIRKLTPKECYRLMGFTDSDFEKARKELITKFYNGKDKANSQLYHQAGNSIVVQVLEAIFKQLL